MKVFLHIGVAKTGSSAIEQALLEREAGLAAQGLYAPQATRAGRGRHIKLGAYALDDDRMTPMRRSLGLDADALPGFRRALEAALSTELEGKPDAKALIFTDVGLCSLKTASEVARLRRLLETWADSVEIIIYMRRQDRFAVSRHHQDLKAGRTSARILKPRPFIDYAWLAELWAEGFGEGGVRLRVYEDDQLECGDAASDFLSLVGAPPSPEQPAGRRLNTGFAPEADLFLLALNRRLEQDGAIGQSLERKAFLSRLGRLWPGAGRRPRRADAEAFLQGYAASNEAVRRKWFPDRQSLFSTDMSDYPEQATEAGDATSDAVRAVAAAAAVWPEAEAAGYAAAIRDIAARKED